MKPCVKTSCAVVLCFGLLATGVSGCKRSPEEPQLQSAQEVLDAMVAAYKKAESYSDRGELRLVAELEGQKSDNAAPFSVALVRPNKIGVRAYQAELAIDGEQMLAKLSDLPDQALAKDAPAKLTPQAIYADQILASALVGKSGAPPQLALLLEKEPLKQILGDAEQPELGEPADIDGHKCYCVQAKWPGNAGVETLWIDQKTFLLRRLEYPVGGQEKNYFPNRQVKNLSVTANFKDAQLNAKVSDEKFQIEVPDGADIRRFFPELDPRQLLARKIGPFGFADLDGNGVTRESLAGKTAVLCFWESDSPQSRQALEQLEKLSQLYVADNAPVRFLAVSVDPGDRENKTLIETFDKWGIRLPIVRDGDQNVFTVFRTKGVPTIFVLDARGSVQHCEIGFNPDLVTQLAPKLEELAAGKSIYGEPLRRYRAELARAERMLAAKPAARSAPAVLKLAPLWKLGDVKEPGNVLVVADPKAAPRLAVVSGPRAVAEVGLDGKLLATHALGIDAEQESVSILRTAAAADGTRYYAAFEPGQQRVHVFDARWKKLFSYPPDALEKESRHAGIGDCTLADLDGDGKPELYIGYLGMVGVQAVSLEGKRLFSNRPVANVYRLIAGDRDEEGHRSLFCGTAGDNLGTLVLLDEKLERRGEVMLPDCPLRWFTAADLTGSGKLQWCGLTIPRTGETVVAGLELVGKETWKYALPEGLQQRAIEPIIAGRVTAALPGQWLLPGVDGSIHVLAADGKPLDKFNYGALINGMATTTLDGKPVLIIASSGGLEALRVE